ncbi:hypothetical protein CUU56_16790 [Pectobacterium parvum]|uniref:Uncharacterized protein n=1 Tax=Pectobacterium parvum TaxID=2778550 RepID=A0AAP9LCF4_9GAMM|nr:hypothetical protein [Pectobacterium parvum]QHQ24136.1 hypothetical protein GMX10_08660 [Pectobacterium parvum]
MVNSGTGVIDTPTSVEHSVIREIILPVSPCPSASSIRFRRCNESINTSLSEYAESRRSESYKICNRCFIVITSSSTTGVMHR